MKRLFIILGLSLFFIGCSKVNKEEKIKRIEWHQIDEVILISKRCSCMYPYYITERTAYVMGKDGKVYYVNQMPEDIYNIYFKNSEKGDTIRL